MPPLRFEIINDTFFLNLSWYGFTDTESDINLYYISVGYTYSGSELIDSSRFLPNISSFGNEYRSNISFPFTEMLSDHLILSIWADNLAGLRTDEAKITTEIVYTNKDHTKGSLLIQKHSCRTEFCNNDCTCAVIRKQCSYENNMTCIENKSRENVKINVKMTMDNIKTNVIGSKKCLSTHWSSKASNSHILRYEYGFGILGEEVGQGVYNLSIQSPWRDNGHKTDASYCLLEGNNLRHKTSYVSHVRAWISSSEYLTFTSLPALVDHSPPDIHKRQFVRDSEITSCDDDIDYISNITTVYACWDNVFEDKESEVQRYMVSLGTSPSMDDVRSTTDVGKMIHITWSDVVLEEGIRYYTTVTAVNSIGLKTEASSDGFMIDNSPPTAGIVYNTGKYRNTIVQSQLIPVKFSWHGFTDQHSSIESYHIAYMVNEDYINGSVHFSNIGLHNNILYNKMLQHGDKIVALVKTRDKAGHESPVVMSPPLYIDATPPVTFQCNNYENKINHTENVRNNNRWNFTKFMSLNLHDVMKIKVSVTNVRFRFRGNLQIDDLSIMIPFTVNADESVFSSYIYVSQKKKTKNIAIRLEDIGSNSVVDIRISKCSNLTFGEDIGKIITKQISTDSLSVCVPTLDKESGIKQISLQVGSILYGCETETLHPIASHLHAIIKGNFTHGMTVFIKANVENHAGLHSDFIGLPLTIDHTGPEISINTFLPKFEIHHNSSLIRLESTWEVVDDESDVTFCEYCIGMVESSCNVIEWTPTLSFSSFNTKLFGAQHGSKIFGAMRCVNSVELVGLAFFGPIIISYKLPVTADSTVQFIFASTIDVQIQPDSNSVTVRWNEFRDLSEVDNYYVSNSNSYSDFERWQLVRKRNYVKISGLPKVNRKVYQVGVKGTNIGGMESSIVNNSILIDNTKPILTGYPVEVEHQTKNDFLANWSSVFTFVDYIREFQVSIGTADGSTDILMPTSTTNNRIDFYVPKDITILYFVITATLATDKATVYREKINLG